jgi:hypothetical protein
MIYQIPGTSDGGECLKSGDRVLQDNDNLQWIKQRVSFFGMLDWGVGRAKVKV